MIRKMKGRVAFALAASTIAFAPAQALTINLHDVGGVTGTSAEIGFKIAAGYWESVLTNDAVVNLDVGYAPLAPKVLGSTGSNLFTYVPIELYYQLLDANKTSVLDNKAVANLAPLSATGSVQLVVPGYLDPATQTGIDNTAASRFAPDGMEISNTLALSSANVKALVGGFETVTDASITFSSNFAFDFNPTDGIAPGTYDFIGVAIHEIGHALGFISGADDFDYSDGYAGTVDDAWWAYGLDMFRYGKNADGSASLNIMPGDEDYFSIDGGLTAYEGGYFSTGENFGDTWQASHWKSPGDCSVFLGIMNPYICNGKGDEVTGLDLALFDAIGWNLADGARDNAAYLASTSSIFYAITPTIPEIDTWAQMVLGFGLLGSAMRLRTRKVAVRFA